MNLHFYLFTFLPGVTLKLKFMPQDFFLFLFFKFFYVVTVLWTPDSGLKTAHFTILPRGLVWSKNRSQDGSFYILPSYLFTWGCSEVHIQPSRQLILPYPSPLTRRIYSAETALCFCDFENILYWYYHGVSFGCDWWWGGGTTASIKNILTDHSKICLCKTTPYGPETEINLHSYFFIF